jgi:CheY-like chemotaxis protein
MNHPINEKPDWSGYTILVVEDDYFNFKFLEGWMNRMHADIIRAESGKEAVAMCLERNDIHVVLMDLQLPEMNGCEAMKMIKQHKPDLPVIIVSANAVYEEQRRSEEAGCDGFITKPIDLKQLMITLNKFLPNR